VADAGKCNCWWESGMHEHCEFFHKFSSTTGGRGIRGVRLAVSYLAFEFVILSGVREGPSMLE